MTATGTTKPFISTRELLLAVVVMTLVVLASNILVQYPIHAIGAGEWLTWGAISYPFAFLVNDLSNRRFGPAGARRVVYVGFVAAVLISIVLATPRIAIASGSAFLFSQLLDIFVFQKMRRRAWWLQPFVASLVASALDTAIFFSFAFYCGPLFGTDATISSLLGAAGIADQCQVLPWTQLAIADYGMKVILAAIAILPYGALITFIKPMRPQNGSV
ncbi:queuosine precursor transporter [Microvirga sp. W0021]|uniref:Probable queuosine precursor transporter n=1 Tax=Hohaiivirga grylli TaxID=3133970 RepID=A0ABV0BKR0_9HYPH